MGLERLTQKDRYGHYYTSEKVNDRIQHGELFPHAFDGKPIDKLAEYEDLEEQGLLLKLPCKVGDTVYRLIPKTYRNIEPLTIKDFVLCENGLCFTTTKTTFYYSCDKFGEFIFLTQEEAEQALKEMEKK